MRVAKCHITKTWLCGMVLTILLSEVFGIYLIIVGATIMVRRDYFVRAIAALAHNHWSLLPEAIMTLDGWR